MFKQLLFLCFPLCVLGACVGPADKTSEPNMIQRSSILSANNKAIVIEHSTWGKPIAFSAAEKHCSSIGKTAVYKSSHKQAGPDVISSWLCEE